jgi:hypothetical protein
MKRLFVLATVAFAVLVSTATAMAQQAQRVNYRATTYYKVAPEKEAAMLEQARTTGRKIIQEDISAGLPIVSYSLLRVMYQGTPAMEYNYAVTVLFDGAPPELNTAMRDQVFRKATGMSFQDYLEKQINLRSNVGNVLYRVEATAPGSKVAEGNYIAIVRWKITPQRGADYGNFVQSMLLPFNTETVKAGRSIGWTAARVVSPGGADAPFDAVTSTTYKDLAAALPTTTPNADQAQMQFAKVFPGQSFLAFVDQGRALRRAVRTELARVMVEVDR